MILEVEFSRYGNNRVTKINWAWVDTLARF